MSLRTPRVSVCIPAYNAAPYLPAAIESVLAQGFTDFELVVSDDASTDDTVSVCDNYSDSRFRAVRSEARLGQSGNWNRCVELARGEYVILLHADDELLAAYLPRAVSVLDANRDVGLVHCAVQHVDAAGVPQHLQRLFDEDTIDHDDLTLGKLLLDGCVINPAGVLVRRHEYEAVGPFTGNIVWGVDWHMWIRIALRWPVAYMAEPLALYRQHGHSGTSSVMASGRHARDEVWLFEDVFDLIGRTRPELSELKPAALRGVAHRTWCFAEEMCARGDLRTARTGLGNAIRIWPGIARRPTFWGLWFATYTSYRLFSAAQAGKNQITRTLGRGAAVRH